MRKTVIKTVLLTLISFIAVVFISYGFLATLSPKILANAWADVGNYDISIKYYEKQYEKTEDISDLAIVCNKVNEAEDGARAVKYLELLTENEGFSEFCQKEDELGGYEFTAYEFYFGKYACAAFYHGGIADAVAVAKKSISKGYTKYNAFYLLLGTETLTAEDGTAIKSEIESLTGLSAAERDFAERDITLANSIK